MHVAVLGAGVTGVTTAYYLATHGHRVSLIDRASEAAAETSHANGAQLSYSYTDPLAQPSMPARLPGIALGRDPAIRVRVLGNPDLYRWGTAFLAQCRAPRTEANMLAVLDLALRSAGNLRDIRRETAIEFHWRRAGKLVVLRSDAEAAVAGQRAELKRSRGCDVRLIGRDEAEAIEPALADMRQAFAAAVYAPGDEVGDARLFCANLADWLQRERDVDLLFGTSVEAIRSRNRRVESLALDGREFEVDAVVVCLGPWSRDLLRPLGIGLPIYPIRGYSITLPSGTSAPSVSVTSVEKRLVYSVLGDRVRIAGYADFVGLKPDAGFDHRRIVELAATARSLAPLAADYEAADRAEWGGYRPVTPDSRPLVGPTAIRGLYLNTGHGVLGWTLACATASDVADAVSRSGG